MDFYLGHENISRGTIKKLRCKHCNFECDCFKIVGDTEAMNFLGVIGLTNLNAKEIFITHLTRQEYQEYGTIDSKRINARLEKLLKRSNLVYFRNKFDTQGRIFLSCPICESEMATTNEITLSEYVNEGGKIYTIGNYPND